MGQRNSAYIPNEPADVSAEWVTSAMRAAGVLPDHIKVTEVTPNQISGGVGMAGITERFRLSYDNDDPALPSSVIGKFAATEPIIKGLLESLDAYAREISFYRDLAPRMPIRVPRFCGGGFDGSRGQGATEFAAQIVDRLPMKAQLAITADVTKFLRPSSRRYALLIEDFGDDNDVHDLVAPPDPDALIPVMEQLAAMHAAFWGDASLAKYSCTRRLVTTTPSLYSNVFWGRGKALMQERWSNDWLTPHHVKIVETAADRFRADLELLNRPITLVHGDPRSDNVLYGSDGPLIVDWALVGYGNPAFDVGYLIGSSVRVEDMRLHAEPLARRYLRALAANGRTVRFEHLWEGVGAVARAIAIQAVMGLPYPLADYGGDGRAEDHWLPRLIALADTVGTGR